MARFIDLTGKRFGMLVAVRPIRDNGVVSWVCQCDCGNEKTVRRGNLTGNQSSSCGCSQYKKGTSANGFRHGHSSRKELGYSCWMSMKSRCHNSKDVQYENYGGRGISVCQRWLEYKNFIADMGERPSLGHSIERLDNDGNYCPENCRWATEYEQKRNTRQNVVIEHGGLKMCLADWSLRLGVKRSSLDYYRKKFPFGEAIELATKSASRVE